MSELDLFVLGDVNPDVIVSGTQLSPRFDQVEQLVDRAALVVGGSASITAVAAARLGLSVGLCGVVGDDDLGRFMIDRLTAADVDLGHVRIDASTPTGLSVMLDRGPDRAILTAPGTIAALSPADLEGLADRPARHVHVASYYLMSDAYRQALPAALRRFRGASVTTSLDTNWDPGGTWDLEAVLAETDVFLPNRAELLAVTACASVPAALDAMAAHGCDVVVKLGEVGATARTPRGTVHVAATRPPSLADAVGAGDTFDAGFVAGRLCGLDDEQALRLAVAAGTLSTRGVGGTATQPDRSEAQAWADRLTATSGAAEDDR